LGIAPPGPADIRQRLGREDSDVIVALIRTAFIIAYYLLRAHGYPRPEDGHSDALWRYALQFLDVIVLVAALFNLLLLLLYLRGLVLRRMRPLALVVDLVLIGTAIAVFRRAGYDAFDLYYLIVIPAAVWYRRVGAITVAVAATIIATAAPHLLFQTPAPEMGWVQAGVAQGVWLLLIGLIAGYMMRARDAEHVSMLELRQEMRLARVLQSRMLPEQLPQLPSCDLGLVFEPARQVGGDFYDLRLLDPDHLLIVLADMSGKSVYGLVHLSLVHSHLRAALNEGLSPAEAALRVNQSTYEALQPESYAALFIGILRLSDGMLTCVNCGHVPPLVVPAEAQASSVTLSTAGTVIGAWREACYDQREVQLAPGDTLLCFSDGVSEVRNRKREFFGEERVTELVRQHRGQGAQETADALRTAANKFAARPGHDDITVIALRRL
jgi:hypothetical protein